MPSLQCHRQWPCVHVVLLGWLTCGASITATAENSPRPLPAYRIEAKQFGAGESDIRAVCNSVIQQFWKHFPDYKLEPFVVERGRKGPIVHYRRNDRGEIVMQLDTGELYWSQYAYQFAHEFCHLLCQFEDDFPGNKWFEETLCETASLYALRAMARSWASNPPYSNWKSYRHSLASYVDDVIRKRDLVREIYQKGLSGFYLAHKEELTTNATRRELNGAMAVVLLHLLERKPEHWEAVRWINHASSPQGETFPDYLSAWHRAVPQRHKPFVAEIAQLYGIAIEAEE